jgi:hypothetical protein
MLAKSLNDLFYVAHETISSNAGHTATIRQITTASARFRNSHACIHLARRATSTETAQGS